MKKISGISIIVLLISVSVWISGCTKWFIPQANRAVTRSITPQATSTWTPVPLSSAGIQTPAAGKVAVSLSTAKGSPSLVWFEVYDQNGEKLWQGGEWTNILYLTPGNYYYNAMAPIPTQPLGCYNVEQDYGYYLQENFTVKDKPIVIEVKLGIIISFCTLTPTP